MEDPRVMVNVSQSAGHDFTNQLETNQDLGQDPTHSHEQIQNQSQSRRDTDGWKLQQQWEVSLQPGLNTTNVLLFTQEAIHKKNVSLQLS